MHPCFPATGGAPGGGGGGGGGPFRALGIGEDGLGIDMLG